MKCEHCNNEMKWEGSLMGGRMSCAHCECIVEDEYNPFEDPDERVKPSVIYETFGGGGGGGIASPQQAQAIDDFLKSCDSGQCGAEQLPFVDPDLARLALNRELASRKYIEKLEAMTSFVAATPDESVPNTQYVTCSVCLGAGLVFNNYGPSLTCPICHGRGVC